MYLSKNFQIVKVHFTDINMGKNKIRILHTWNMVVINVPLSNTLAKYQNRQVIDMKMGTTFAHTCIIPKTDNLLT